MSRIAVTGASGFIGGAIATRLLMDGHDVRSFGRTHPGLAGIRHLAWDIAGGGEGPGELRSVDAVVHAAAHVAPWGPADRFQAVTVDGTARLLDVVAPTARLVMIGSASVYDPRIDHDLAREGEAPVASGRYLNEYGRSKAAQERLVFGRRPDAIVLRPRAVWGPGDRTLLPRLLARVRGGRLVLPAGGRRPLSSTHISSLVTAVTAALDRPGVRGPVNVADATPRTAAELVAAVLAAAGRDVRLVSIPGPLADLAAGFAEAGWRVLGRSGEPPVTRYAVAALAHAFTLDLTRLHDELGVRPDVDLGLAARELAAVIRSRSGAGISADRSAPDACPGTRSGT